MDAARRLLVCAVAGAEAAAGSLLIPFAVVFGLLGVALMGLLFELLNRYAPLVSVAIFGTPLLIFAIPAVTIIGGLLLFAGGVLGGILGAVLGTIGGRPQD